MSMAYAVERMSYSKWRGKNTKTAALKAKPNSIWHGLISCVLAEAAIESLRTLFQLTPVTAENLETIRIICSVGLCLPQSLAHHFTQGMQEFGKFT